MRILHIGKYDFDFSGGMERFVRSLSTGLVGQGKQVKYVFADKGSKTHQSMRRGVELEALPIQGKIASLSLFKLDLVKIQQWNPDLIHVHIPNPMALHYLKKINIPRVITYHADVDFFPWMNKVYNLHLKSQLKSSDSIVFTSDSMKRNVTLTKLPLHQEVIPIGVSALRGESSLKVETQFDFVFVGRLVKYKALLEFLDLLAQTPWSLAIVGAGPLEKKIRKKVEDQKLTSRVSFFGDRNEADVKKVIRHSKVLVLPSRSRAEAFGIALVEAMYESKPLLTYNLPTGVGEVNTHGENGWVARLDQPQDMLKGMAHLMSSAELRKDLGLRGLKKAKELYSTEVMVKSYLRCYEKTLARF